MHLLCEIAEFLDVAPAVCHTCILCSARHIVAGDFHYIGKEASTRWASGVDLSMLAEAGDLDPADEPLRGRSYDKFLVSKSPVTGLQFLGLLIIGGSLIAVSLITLAVMLRDVRPSQLTVSALTQPSIFALGNKPKFRQCLTFIMRYFLAFLPQRRCRGRAYSFLQVFLSDLGIYDLRDRPVDNEVRFPDESCSKL
jgi:hypothetical protein